MVASVARSAGREVGDGREIGHRKRVAAEGGEEQAERRAPRLADRGLAAGKPERAKARHAAPAGLVDPNELAAPDGAVGAVAGAVPGDAEDGRRQAMLGHAGRDVGDVMLDRDDRNPEPFGGAGRMIVGVEVADDEARHGPVQPAMSPIAVS